MFETQLILHLSKPLFQRASSNLFFSLDVLEFRSSRGNFIYSLRLNLLLIRLVLIDWKCSWHLKDLVTFRFSSAKWWHIEILLLLVGVILNLVILILGVIELFLFPSPRLRHCRLNSSVEEAVRGFVQRWTHELTPVRSCRIVNFLLNWYSFGKLTITQRRTLAVGIVLSFL